MSRLLERARRQNRGFLGHDNSALPPDQKEDLRQLRFELDLNSWNPRIWGVAASGFFTDSYNLFSTSAILTSISFVYFPDDRSGWQNLVVNLATLIGSVFGQLLFGCLADYYGRTRLYGAELTLVVVSTMGAATASPGYHDTLSFVALFAFWRFIMGIGVGAEYPLSGIIVSEWSSTQARATMLSSVFMMQPIGQAVAQLVSLWVLLGFDSTHHLRDMQCGLNDLYLEECKRAVDIMWRIVIASGAVPALVAIVFRFFLYDAGLYELEVRGDSGATGPSEEILIRSFNRTVDLGTMGNFHSGHGTSATWFFLDMGFFGMTMYSKDTLSSMWSTGPDLDLDEGLWCWESPIAGARSTVPGWKTDGPPQWAMVGGRPCMGIYDVLKEQARQYVLTVSVASVAGSACFIAFADRLPRREWLVTSFVVLAAIFTTTGCVHYAVAHTGLAPFAVASVALSHFLLNFGANTLTFMMPAEIFPTCYRGTCHGVSAAAGKLGSIVALLLVYAIHAAYDSSTRQGLVLILFGALVTPGAIFAWAYLPDVQRRCAGPDGRKTLVTKKLEELGQGRRGAMQQEEVISLRAKISIAKERLLSFSWKKSSAAVEGSRG